MKSPRSISFGRFLIIIPLIILLAPTTGFPAGEAPPPEQALFLVFRSRPLDRAFLANFGEVIRFEADSALIRTTQARSYFGTDGDLSVSR